MFPRLRLTAAVLAVLLAATDAVQTWWAVGQHRDLFTEVSPGPAFLAGVYGLPFMLAVGAAGTLAVGAGLLVDPRKTPYRLALWVGCGLVLAVKVYVVVSNFCWLAVMS